MSSRWCAIALLVGSSIGCTAAPVPPAGADASSLANAKSGDPEPAPTPVFDAGVAAEPSEIAAVFPPKWKLGDRWRVTMNVGVWPGGLPYGVYWRTMTFTMRVEELPKDVTGVYRIALDREDGKRYVFEYRAGDGSFARGLRSTRDRPPRLVPFVTSASAPLFEHDVLGEAFIYSFPVAPSGTRFQNPMSFSSDDPLVRRLTQRMERRDGGVRFVVEREFGLLVERAVLDWNAGEPWWSTARVVLVPTAAGRDLAPEEPEEKEVASGTLLRDADAGPPH